jgi:hypothetical protein
MIIKKFNIKWINNCNYTNYTSISLWKNFVLANKINSNTIQIFDRENGKYLNDILDKDLGFFEIKNADDNLIINDILFRIDSFLGTCQVYNLKLNILIGIFGFKNLKLPKCLSGFYQDEKYIIFIYDDISKSIIKYEINIFESNINNIKKFNFISLPEINISNILIDLELNRILINDQKKSKLFILDITGKLKKIIDIEISSLIIHGKYYIYSDIEKDTNMIHLICRKNLNYIMSYMSKILKNITYMTSDNNDIYVLDNDCTLAKLSIENNNNNLLLIIIGLIISKILIK